MTTTTIEWAQQVWNPLVGCTVHSPGCTNCYAMRMAYRLEAMAKEQMMLRDSPLAHYCGTTRKVKGNAVWTGQVNLAPESTLLAPLRRKKPTRYFVNSMSDLFHESVPDEWIDQIFAVMALCPQHTFQVLTKRSDRMREYLSGGRWAWRVIEAKKAFDRAHRPGMGGILGTTNGALPNVWLGVSVEDQTRADQRIPDLLNTPAAVRWISAEPLLGPVDLRQWQHSYGCGCGWGGDNPLDFCRDCDWLGHATGEIETYPPSFRLQGIPVAGCGSCGKDLDGSKACPECEGEDSDGLSFGPNSRPKIDWIVVGGESGKSARPMHPDWARSLRDQCAAANVPFFFKQWGEWGPEGEAGDHGLKAALLRGEKWDFHTAAYGEVHNDRIGTAWMQMDVYRVGKKAAGRLLDGIEHNAMPSAA